MIFISLLTIGLFMPVAVSAQGAFVITNSKIATGSLDMDTIKKIYSGYITKWPDGTRITVTMMENSPFHEDFLKTYVGKTKTQFSSSWKKRMFTGKGKYPTNFKTIKELVDFVAKTEGAIGYVNDGAKPQGVSVHR